MRGCTRCGATFATEVLFCPRDGAATVAAPAGPGAPSWTPNAIPRPTSPRGASKPSDPFIGKKVGNFQLTRRLGAGGMGAVYEGVHPVVGFRVAVKLLGGQSALDRELVERFFVEARTLNQLAHENIVRAIDLGQHEEGFYYCVMELLDGETLAALQARGRPVLGQALEILAQACDGLSAAHDKGVVHRDLKPANIMLVKHPATGRDLVKLVDFGIAKLQRAQASANATVHGTVIGTPAYMSPEQAAGRVGEIDPRSDIYALGVVAYELVTGHHPFEGLAVGDLLVAQVVQEPTPPGRIFSLPERLDAALVRALRKRKEERFPDAGSFAAELRAIIEDLSRPAPPPRAPTPVAQTPVEVPAVPTPATVTPRATTPVKQPPVAKSVRPAVASPRIVTGAGPASGPVRLAQRKPPRAPRRPTVRPLFLLAFALSGVMFGAAVVGLFDVEPVIGTIAKAVGLAPAPIQARLAVPPAFDGVNAAFEAGGPALAGCRPAFDALRAWKQPTNKAVLSESLFARLDGLSAFEQCVARAPHPEAGWSAPYLTGVAALEFAMALDALPEPLLLAAHELRDGEIAPFWVELYASRAADRFRDAAVGAPDTQRLYIDRFGVDLDLLRQRARPQ